MVIPTLAVLFSVIVATDPPVHAVSEHVDLIEINHYFDDSGKSIFDQLIYYNWDDKAKRFNVCAWRLVKNKNQLPVRQAGSDKYYTAWYDGKILRVVYADRTYESWTQHDPETLERLFFPKELRPDLYRLREPKK